MRIVVGSVLGCVALAGCFEYAPVPPSSTLPQATPMRVRLAAPVDVPIRDVTVRGVTELRGEAIAFPRDTVRLSVFGLRSATGYAAEASGETVSLPRASVAAMERKRLSPWRSGLLAAVVIAGGLTAHATGLVSGGGGTGPPSGGAPK